MTMKTQLKTYAAAAKLLQLCPTLCDPIDSSTPGSPVPGILQARTLDWVCHFLLQCMKVKSESEVAQSCPTLRNPMHGLQHTRLLCPWDFPGKSTGVGCHWDAAEAVLRGKFIAIKAYLKKQEKHLTDSLILHLKQLDKGKQQNLKICRRKEIIKI